MSTEILVLVMFGCVLLGIFAGFPIAFVLTSIGFVFGYLELGTRIFRMMPNVANGVMTDYILVAVPLFVFMGCMLEESKVSEKAFDVLYQWIGHVRGGLAIATIILSTLFAACTGIVGASVTTMGLIALPAMKKHGYDPSLSTGVVGAGGTLGILIPPSIMLILFAPMAGLSVIDLFASAMVPGLLLSACYIVYVFIRATINPEMAPKSKGIPKEDKIPLMEAILIFAPFILLILSVLGAIFFGIAAPTEAAGVGALGSIIIAAAFKKLNWNVIQQSALTTVKISSMVIFITIGAKIFTTTFFTVGGGRVIERFVTGLGLGQTGLMIFVLFLVFILGMFIDWIGILLIVVPILMPILADFGIDTLWAGMLIVVILQSSFLTPPFAYTLFYIRGIAPAGITIQHIYKGVIPFIAIQLFVVIMSFVFPQLITWLPRALR